MQRYERPVGEQCLRFSFRTFWTLFSKCLRHALHQQGSRKFSTDTTCRHLEEGISCRTNADRSWVRTRQAQSRSLSSLEIICSLAGILAPGCRMLGRAKLSYLDRPEFIPVWPLPGCVAWSTALQGLYLCFPHLWRVISFSHPVHSPNFRYTGSSVRVLELQATETNTS